MRTKWLAAVVAIIFPATGSAQVMLNQVDNFSSGTANWENLITGLVTVQLGGPSGATDNFLRVATNGATFGPGSLLIASNQMQWLGNYTAQGISAIEMDLKNINYPNAGAGMAVRIVFRTGTGGASTPAYVSDPFTLLNDGNWHHAVFPLEESNFTAFNSPPSFASVLAGGTADFRILHNFAAMPIGQATNPIPAELGVDNIMAVGVPEPCAMILCAVGVTGMIGRSLRHKRKSAL